MAPMYREYAERLGIDPVKYMLDVVADSKLDHRLRLDAAKASAPYLAPRLKLAEVMQFSNFSGDPASISNDQLLQIIHNSRE